MGDPTATQQPIRENEIETMISKMPLNGYNMQSPRVFTIWGDYGVGKSTFISLLRESSAMKNLKVLWLQPVLAENLTTPQEFIAACSESVRYPQSPDKEESISEAIENSQRGRMNPVVSDDSILIMRSDLASNKGPYINEAAAASVGRTKHIRSEIQISVGLGDNPAGNQAEAFLDALPLQSLGTDAIILHIKSWKELSISIRDWFLDYVVPAASKGPYRRNLLLLTESIESNAYRSDLETWGDWEEYSLEYRLPPLSEKDVNTITKTERLPESYSPFIYSAGSGYPEETYKWIENLRIANPSTEPTQIDLPPVDLANLAACCLPNTLHRDELDCIFGHGKGKPTLDWLSSLGIVPIQKSPDGLGPIIETKFRAHTIAQAISIPTFKALRKRFLPYGRVLRNIPNKSDRSKLLQLCCLRWIGEHSAEKIFPSKAKKVLEYINLSEKYFVHKHGKFMISERLRDDLITISEYIGNETTTALAEKAQQVWITESQSIEETKQSLKDQLSSIHKETEQLTRKQTEAEAYLRSLEKKTSLLLDAHASHIANQASNGNLLILLTALTATLFLSTGYIPYPYNLGTFLGGLATLCIGLAQMPKWLDKRKVQRALDESKDSKETERVVKERDTLSHQAQEKEAEIARIQREIDHTKDLLSYPYV